MHRFHQTQHGYGGHCRPRHRHGGFGPPPGFGPRGGGRRARRGDVRTAILRLLGEESRNGYQLMQEIEQRSGGAWRPSPGSVYPALQQLQDEGLVEEQKTEGGRTFGLTDAGRTYVEENAERLGAPWDAAAGQVPDELGELRAAVGQLFVATRQLAETGSPEQLKSARTALDDARKAIYRILSGE